MPLRRPQPPAVKGTAWPRGDIDRFVLAALEAKGLKPSPEADRRTLIRRLYFDLIGLPPTPEEMDAFISDNDPAAYEKLVDRLLVSPHYGERWARHWLDVARYGETHGYDKDKPRPNAWPYRDYVIRAFNADMPYDQFVRYQLAADLLEGGDSAHIAALGFIGLGPKYYSRRSLQVMSDEWEDRVDVVGRGLLGLTVACARCHDHKFDPIGTEDYYALAGVFASTAMFNRPLTKDAEQAKSEQVVQAGEDEVGRHRAPP